MTDGAVGMFGPRVKTGAGATEAGGRRTIFMREQNRQNIHCILCGPTAKFHVRFEERLPGGELNFAARRMPEKLHCRIVECDGCGLVFSNPILPGEKIAELYRETKHVDETQLVHYLDDYLAQFRAAAPLAGTVDRLLEVGCGNGYFLTAVKSLGVREVVGVEPGKDAVQNADPGIRRHIINDFFRDGLVEDGAFDMVCLFQLLDHALDPLAVVTAARKTLRPGGILLAVNHNIRAWMPRLLGEGCPMYDVQHVYLFDLKTARLLIEKAGLECVRISNISNGYDLAYAIKMLPAPTAARKTAIGFLNKSGLSRVRPRIKAGNMAVVARRPAGRV